MPKSGGQSRQRADFWAEKAKKEGYPARSVYKLEEILHKNPSLIAKGSKVLDLGAAPGSWSLFLAKRWQCQLVSCDLKALQLPQKPAGIASLTGDFTSPAIQRRISALGPYAAVVSDAAPATSGDRLVDCARSLHLAQTALNIAVSQLQAGGSFIAKVFSGGDEEELFARAKEFFSQVKTAKPKAVRSSSFELYLLAFNFKKTAAASEGEPLP